MSLKAHLLSREVLPFYLSLALLAAVALLCDALLHYFNVVWIGRYLGIPGTLLILGSFGYSLRKRKMIKSGQPVTLLRWHERMAWAGSLLILVHAGIHFNAILGWLAVWAMLINVGSGLTGKYLLGRARARMEASREQMRAQGHSPEELEAQLHRMIELERDRLMPGQEVVVCPPTDGQVAVNAGMRFGRVAGELSQRRY